MLCYRCALLNFKELAYQFRREGEASIPRVWFFHNCNDYMLAGLGDSEFGYELNKTRTKLKSRYPSAKRIHKWKHDGAVCHIACDLKRFSIECRETKTKVTQTVNQKKWENLYSTWEHKVIAIKRPEAWESADDHFVIDFSFASDWLKEWCEFSGPITKRCQLLWTLNFKGKLFSYTVEIQTWYVSFPVGAEN